MIIIKNEEQIEGIRKACKLAAKALKHAKKIITSGMTTEELDYRVHDFIVENGGIPAPLNYKNFPKSTCVSLNEVVCHGIPDKTVIKEGDIVKIDVSTILDGYYGDNCTTVAIGKINETAQKLINITKNCLHLGILQVKPGNKFGKIGYAISKYAMEAGFSVVFEYGGHGIGLSFHEDPMISHIDYPNNGEIMQEGMIFTIEPMLNVGKSTTTIDKNDGWTVRTSDNKLSAQFEHTVLVTKTGFEVLTI